MANTGFIYWYSSKILLKFCKEFKVTDQKEKILQIINKGIFTLNEVAFYARMNKRTVSRWFKGDNSTKTVFDHKTAAPQIEVETVNFYEFIEALTIRAIRTQYKISLKKIRNSLDEIKKEYEIDYPFAKNHVCFTDGKEIYIEFKNNFIQVSRPNQHQFTMRPIIEEHLKDIVFDKNNLAKQYRPTEGIVFDPHIRFGEPVLEGSRLKVQTIYDAVIAEGSKEAVAEIYGIDLREVEIAFKYIDSLKIAA